MQTMIDNMPEKTGKSLEEWKKILQEKSFAKFSEAVKFLKEEHGVTHGFANTIVTLSKEENSAPEDLVASQYKGKELTERLENSGPFGAMCTHRVKIESVGEIDSELIGWLEEAYQKAG